MVELVHANIHKRFNFFIPYSHFICKPFFFIVFGLPCSQMFPSQSPPATGESDRASVLYKGKMEIQWCHIMLGRRIFSVKPNRCKIKWKVTITLFVSWLFLWFFFFFFCLWSQQRPSVRCGCARLRWTGHTQVSSTFTSCGLIVSSTIWRMTVSLLCFLQHWTFHCVIKAPR